MTIVYFELNEASTNSSVFQYSIQRTNLFRPCYLF